VNLIPGMNQTPEIAARRYYQASEYGTGVSRQFLASAQGKFATALEAIDTQGRAAGLGALSIDPSIRWELNVCEGRVWVTLGRGGS
jgi:hypothetical protein